MHNLLYKNEYVMRCRYVTDFNMFVIQTESSGQHLVYERDIWIETTDETFEEGAAMSEILSEAEQYQKDVTEALEKAALEKAALRERRWVVDKDDEILGFADDPTRREAIVEITTPEHDQTFGYLIPEYAAEAVKRWNSHDSLVEAVKFALTTPGMIKGRDRLEAALALAED